ncbi:MAG: riboflavin synthase [Spirochaetales bacterium]|nr:riboflavin synthase [Spirochaetales bacterium]
MFTGIIEETGIISSIQKTSDTWILEIEAKKVLENTHIGDSIAVSGICLTVTTLFENRFTVDVSNETTNRSILRNASAGMKINLERALTLSSRLGGHLVSGHVDTTGTITKVEKHDASTVIFFRIPQQYLKYIVDKGSVCIDGISLTAVEPREDVFSVWVIPHTLSHTTLLSKKAGDTVNIECDMIAKYTEKLINNRNSEAFSKTDDSLSTAFLQERGF